MHCGREFGAFIIVRLCVADHGAVHQGSRGQHAVFFNDGILSTVLELSQNVRRSHVLRLGGDIKDGGVGDLRVGEIIEVRFSCLFLQILLEILKLFRILSFHKGSQLIHRVFPFDTFEKPGVKQVGKGVGGICQFLLVPAQIGLREFIEISPIYIIQLDHRDRQGDLVVFGFACVLVRAVLHGGCPVIAEGVFQPLLNDCLITWISGGNSSVAIFGDFHAARHAGVCILADLAGVQDVAIQGLVQTLVGALNVAAVAHRADAG